MVLLHVKRNEDHQFLLDTPAATPLSEVARVVVSLHNARLGLLHLCAAARNLATSSGGQASEQIQQEVSALRIQDAEDDSVTKTDAERRGIGASTQVSESAAQGVLRAVDDATAAVHKRQVEAKAVLTHALVAEHIRAVHAAARDACASSGSALAEDDDIAVLTSGVLSTCGEDAVLWGPGNKAMTPATQDKQLLSDYVGRNDKTKVLIRLQKSGEGQPQREGPSVSAEEQAAMLAFLRRKQEEAARLAASSDDPVDTHDAPWANSRALKTHFSGVGNVRFGF